MEYKNQKIIKVIYLFLYGILTINFIFLRRIYSFEFETSIWYDVIQPSFLRVLYPIFLSASSLLFFDAFMFYRRKKQYKVINLMF